jgi:predicted RecA/RadA family phage recombinase
MKPRFLLMVVLLAGFVGGILWQQSAISRLKAENEQHREKSKQVDSLLAENERLSQEKIDPAELQRLRGSQSELLRLRGQVSLLKREVQEAKTAATALVGTVPQPAATNDEQGELPIQTYVANANASVGWNQALVTGGWKTPSGKRALVLVQPEPGTDANTVTVQTRMVELPENLLSAMGFDSLKTDNRLNARGSALSAEQVQNLVKTLEATDGVDLITAPVVTTLSGRQAQVSLTADHQTASGQHYQVGPTVDIIPTVAADGKTVELVVSAQFSYLPAQSNQ